MNELTQHISKYIIKNFGLLDLNQGKVLIKSPEYKTDFDLKFDNSSQYIQSCTCTYEDSTKLLINYFDCSFGTVPQEHCLMFKLNDNPWFAIYYTDENCLFIYSKDGINWTDCSILVQANVLAGLELLKNIEFKTEKNNYNYVDNFKSIISLYEKTYYSFDEEIEVSSL